MSATALQRAAKVHKAAVCLVPPRSAWARVQEVRLFRDKSFARWPPHINLLYPFLEEACFEEAAQACSEALRSVAGFDVTLARLGIFEHSRSCTLWLHPDAPELQEVQAALASAFPQCSDLSSDPARGIQRFTPHLSLGQWRGRAQAEAAAALLAPAWEAAPLRFQAGGVVLISRSGFDDPFRLCWFVPLGGGRPVALGGSSGVPYLATAGGHSPPAAPPGAGGDPAAELAAELAGLGAARPDGTAWVFSYGANMSPRKLGGARGVHPLQSLPARLPGWRLAFTHRGSMGNLEAAAGGAAAHGVLHRVTAADYVRLANAEHEYRPVEVAAEPYGGGPPLPAVAFVTPEERRIAGGLPPPRRYLHLLQEGAAHWGLEEGYARWLADMPSVDSAQRGPGYYTTPGGQALQALPKIRTGSQPRRQPGQQQARHRRQRQQQQAQVLPSS